MSEKNGNYDFKNERILFAHTVVTPPPKKVSREVQSLSKDAGQYNLWNKSWALTMTDDLRHQTSL